MNLENKTSHCFPASSPVNHIECNTFHIPVLGKRSMLAICIFGLYLRVPERQPFKTLYLSVGILIFLVVLVLFTVFFFKNYKAGGYLRTVPLLACVLVIGVTVVQYREMPETLINATRYFFIPLLIIPGVVFLLHPSWNEYEMPDFNLKASAEYLQRNRDCVVPIHPLNFSIFSPKTDSLISADEMFVRMHNNSSSIWSLKEMVYKK